MLLINIESLSENESISIAPILLSFNLSSFLNTEFIPSLVSDSYSGKLYSFRLDTCMNETTLFFS